VILVNHNGSEVYHRQTGYSDVQRPPPAGDSVTNRTTLTFVETRNTPKHPFFVGDPGPRVIHVFSKKINLQTTASIACANQSVYGCIGKSARLVNFFRASRQRARPEECSLLSHRYRAVHGFLDASICSADVHRDAARRSALRRVRRLPAPRRPDRAELAPRLPRQGTVSHYHVAYSFIPSAC